MKHKHHIIPKHMGGDNNPLNITPPISVYLHAALHKDLYEHYGKTEDFIAWKTLLGQSIRGIKFTNSFKNKLKISQQIRRKREKLEGKNNSYNIGKSCNQETRNKIRIANTGKHPSKETLLKMRNSKLGKKASLETKLKMSKAYSKNWLIIYPSGNEIKIKNLYQYCFKS